MSERRNVLEKFEEQKELMYAIEKYLKDKEHSK